MNPSAAADYNHNYCQTTCDVNLHNAEIMSHFQDFLAQVAPTQQSVTLLNERNVIRNNVYFHLEDVTITSTVRAITADNYQNARI